MPHCRARGAPPGEFSTDGRWGGGRRGSEHEGKGLGRLGLGPGRHAPRGRGVFCFYIVRVGSAAFIDSHWLPLICYDTLDNIRLVCLHHKARLLSGAVFLLRTPALPCVFFGFLGRVRFSANRVLSATGELHHRVHVVGLDETLPEADASLQEEDGDRLVAALVSSGVVGAQVRRRPRGRPGARAPLGLLGAGGCPRVPSDLLFRQVGRPRPSRLARVGGKEAGVEDVAGQAAGRFDRPPTPRRREGRQKTRP